jgi:ferritin-like metal-binding protein YciE
METLTELLEEQLKDLYSAEKQLVKALPAMARKAAIPSLGEAFRMHLEETKTHVERLETIGENLGIRLTGKKCKAMEGLIEEGKEVLNEKGRSAVLDAALIGAAQRVEHYEISAYGTARSIAEHLGHDEAKDLLQETLDEEAATDKKLTEICANDVLSEADTGIEEEENEESALQPAVQRSSRR